MAERRMFARTITESDAFLDMPLSTQALYLHLGMHADDDGFVGGPKRIQRTIGATDDDLRLLLAKHFIIAFPSGVVVVKHWRINNYIQKDRYHKTAYQDEYAALSEGPNRAYTPEFRESDVLPPSPACIQDVSNLDAQNRQDKTRIDKTRIDKGRVPPRARDSRSQPSPRSPHTSRRTATRSTPSGSSTTTRRTAGRSGGRR